VSHSLLHPTRIVVWFDDSLDNLNARLRRVNLRAVVLPPQVRSGVVGPIRALGSKVCLDLLQSSCPSIKLTQRFDLVHPDPPSTDPPYKLVKNSYDFTVDAAEFPSMTARICKPPFATNIHVNLRETHKGKRIYCSKCLGTDHFHTKNHPCSRAVACPNCLSTEHKLMTCPQAKQCRECKSPDHQVLTCPKVKCQLVNFNLPRPTATPAPRRPPPVSSHQYPALPKGGSRSSSPSSPVSASSSSSSSGDSRPSGVWPRDRDRRVVATRAVSLPLPLPSPDQNPVALVNWVQMQMQFIDTMQDQLAAMRDNYAQFLENLKSTVAVAAAAQPPSAAGSSAIAASSGAPLPLLPTPTVATPPSSAGSSRTSSPPSSSSSTPKKRTALPDSSSSSSGGEDDDNMAIEETEGSSPSGQKRYRSRTKSGDGKEEKNPERERDSTPTTSNPGKNPGARPQRPAPKPSRQQHIGDMLQPRGAVRGTNTRTRNGDSSTDDSLTAQQ
jgi:hypothetical protein